MLERVSRMAREVLRTKQRAGRISERAGVEKVHCSIGESSNERKRCWGQCSGARETGMRRPMKETASGE